MLLLLVMPNMGIVISVCVIIVGLVCLIFLRRYRRSRRSPPMSDKSSVASGVENRETRTRDEYLGSVVQSERESMVAGGFQGFTLGSPSHSAVADGYRELIPSGLPVDRAHFTVTAPRAVCAGGAFDLLFWAHFQSEIGQVLTGSRQILGLQERIEMMAASAGPFLLARGTKLTVRLHIPRLSIVSNRKTVLWSGETGLAQFVVTVPSDVSAGPAVGSISIGVNGVRVGKLEFVLNVGEAQKEEVPISTTLTKHKTAFASYANEDRNEVLARVQGMQKALPELKVFVDVLDLRSGKYWEKQLWEVIPKCDVFYLFWCRHAKLSPWVEKEWRCAFAQKGLDFIDPVPLERPVHAPPPDELASKHFNDPILAHMLAESLELHLSPPAALRADNSA